MGRSSKLLRGTLDLRDRALNAQNRRHGVKARRGDATFGEVVHGQTADVLTGFSVPRGPIATVEIGVEVKILAKAMIKQIDRVINDLRNQVTQFRRRGGQPICVAIVGVNSADRMTSFEGDRPFPTTGKGGFLHPIQEAAKAEKRLIDEVSRDFDEFLVLRFRATNEPPYPFEWVDYSATQMDYAAALTRIGSEYQPRF